MSGSDTLVSATNLQPSTSYRFKATNQSTGATSKVVEATTLDTTSSNFTWQTFSFGEHSSSVLYGVSIIDENNIWTVGEIYMNDSTGQTDDDRYNAVHWNGNEWTLERVSVQFRDRIITPMLNDIFAFSSTDIWLSSGVPIHGNGVNWTQYHLFDMGILNNSDGGIESIWGKNSESMYFGGALGSFAHYDGENWQKIETNTALDFYDTYGNPEQGVVAVAAKQSESSDKAILRIKDKLVTEPLPTAPIPFSISGIWFDSSGVTYVVGSRISIKPNIDAIAPWKIVSKETIDHPYLFSIAANGLNDIVTAGGFGELFHFNGAQWTLYNQNITGNLYDVDIEQDIVVAVGYDGRSAFITIGKRE